MKAARQGAVSADKIKLDTSELKRRLGEDFESTLEKYGDLRASLLTALKIKYSASECALSTDGMVSRIGEVEIKSKALSKCLFGYEKCAVLALTLGVDADRFIRRCEAQSRTLGFVADALSSALADSACCEIVSMLFGDGEHSPTFAVGYADSDTGSLPKLLEIADTNRTLGITFTDANLMIPTKSIIVIVGKM